MLVRRADGRAAGSLPLPVLRSCWLTTLGSIRSLGVQSRMSHNATRMPMLNRCGGWVTSR
jgi:hypothetical protein